MKILGIESSCDETAVAIIDSGKILSSLIATQHDVHERFGGVVPELASRRHMENIVPLVSGALQEASMDLDDIEGIAVTNAPGLVGSLLVGISMAKGIAYSKNLPLIGVNHLEGHLNAAMLEFGNVPTPYVGLVVSGGHTSLYFVEGFGKYRLLGATRDDAAGEAFDKVAKLLELGYPGGPAIDKVSVNGNAKAFSFTKPQFSNRTLKGVTPREFDFSFSGIKTAVLHLYKKQNDLSKKFISDLAASFQESVAKILVDQLIAAAKTSGAEAVVISGGVAANRRLRSLLKERADTEKLKSFIPSMEFCTDNAAMIAYIGERRLELGDKSDFTLNAVGNQEIGI
ncbi:MAG: tRNA (adenosine(37)-N6)-threonylcarbamoyltransferase complex transferase subunit TsaD [Deltaproteobacteria bacterium]|jgi:N6-L-threonylcarbamoyladenine synthase|nr:tRNA (adenosine(37)-N6)-threonylcarbamoyltransferase complex transferase subunit TsaD [Deltaproteobacteria bacterium]